MDIRKVFRGISAKLYQDFVISSEIKHNGNKGTFREATLKEFLEKGRLPKRFGIGSGEIIGTTRNTSKQSDLIIYDQLNGLALIYNDDIQVYPIESIYGVIEVKSSLSKEDLFKSLDNIKSVKSLCPNESTTRNDNDILITYPRSKPFGIVFAYSLQNNSLESLTKNLREWEENNPRNLWTNLVVVLEEGIIYHVGKGLQNQRLFSNSEIEKALRASYLAYRKDTLYHFYSTLIDLCSSMSSSTLVLNRYFDPPEKIGKYIVRNHDNVCKPGDEQVYRLNLRFIEKVIQYCKTIGKITQKELFIKQHGSIPLGLDNNFLNYEIYLYDPDNLPGIHEVLNPFELNKQGVFATQKMQSPNSWIEIDGEIYYFPWVYVEEGDTEPIKNKTIQDI